MFEIMACERPALMVGGGECVKLVENAEAGIAVPPASPQELADAIVRLAQEPERLREYGANGRRYVLEHFNRGKLAQRYLDRLRTDFSPDPSAPCP
jgi:glycosyltransferase involved in cell wall biosynthesis